MSTVSRKKTLNGAAEGKKEGSSNPQNDKKGRYDGGTTEKPWQNRSKHRKNAQRFSLTFHSLFQAIYNEGKTDTKKQCE